MSIDSKINNDTLSPNLVEVSIIVPCFNSEKTIGLTLDSISKFKCEKYRYEVIVVDNNSTDKTAEIVKKYPYKYLFEKKRNRSCARNKGAASAKGKYLVFIDSDIILNENWLDEAFLKIESSPFYGGGEGFIYPKVLSKTNYIEVIRSEIKKETYSLLRIAGWKFPMINTAACIYLKAAFEEAGKFDESLNYHEDIDLSRRVFNCGFVLFSSKKLEAYSYNDKATYLGFLKRSYISGGEFFKYNAKWSDSKRYILLKGFLLANLKNCMTVLSSKVIKRIGIVAAIARVSFYIAGSFSYFIKSFSKRVYKESGEPRGFFIDKEGQWGVVELDEKYVLKHMHGPIFKSLLKVFDINVLAQKKKRFETLVMKSFLESFEIEPVAAFLTGGHALGLSPLSRGDVDIVVFFNDLQSLESFKSDYQRIKYILNQKLDLTFHLISSARKNNILINLGIKSSKVSIENGICILGNKALLERLENGILDSSLDHVLKLILKKIDFFLQRKKTVIFEIEYDNHFDLITLYKILSLINFELFKSEIVDYYKTFVENLRLLGENEEKTLKFIVDNNFILTKEEFNKREKDLCLIRIKILIILQPQFKLLYKRLKENIHVLKIESADFDYNYIDQKRELSSKEYKELFLAKTGQIIEYIQGAL